MSPPSTAQAVVGRAARGRRGLTIDALRAAGCPPFAVARTAAPYGGAGEA
ncbi:hypothetical protein TBS_22030 [Thermobispora bispora]|nr:hypothetical protein [Thermobispora sp.]